MLGRVKSWNDYKAIGFITPDGGGKDIVFRAPDIAPGFKGVKEGESVSFNINTGPKGEYASDVTVIE